MDVPQKQFGFAKAGSGRTELETGDVLTCMGLVAVHRDSGPAFLMHLDVPWWDDSVRAALTELRDRCGSAALKEVKLFDVAGVTPRMSGIASAALGVSVGFATESLFLGSFTFLICLYYLVGTRARVRFLLWRLGFNQPALLAGRDASGKVRHLGDFRVNVSVSTTGDRAFEPVLTFPNHEDRSPKFLVVPPLPPATTWWGQARDWLLHEWEWGKGRHTRAANSL